MCAISGLLKIDGSPVDLGVLERISAKMRNRGPDGHAAVSYGACALAHERLAIVDIEGGRQPLVSEDGRVAAIVNGEIYNHAALRRELTAAGHRFATQSDSEVVVHGYEEFGTGIFERLHGMFAIALWDDHNRVLLLARDGLGKKPLACTWIENTTFAFASDVRAFHAHPGFRPRLRDGAIAEYLGYNAIAEPGSIYEGVFKVPAGEWLAIAADGSTRSGTHWLLPGSDPVLEYDSSREAEFGEHLRGLVRRAVERRLMSDVPLGVLLSGGLDSTLIAYEAARLSPGVHSFTLGFLGSDDECDTAQRTASALGTRHTERRIELDPRRAIEDAEAAYDEPFADSSAIASVALCRGAREQVGVVLTGDGGDEAFAGYPRARMFAAPPLGLGARLRLHVRSTFGPPRMRSKAKKELRMIAVRDQDAPDFTCWRSMLWIFSPEEVALMTGRHVDSPQGPEPCAYSDTEADDYRVNLRNKLLVKMDRASMHCGLEARSPLLDTELVGWTRQLEVGWKLRHGQGKYLLRRAYADQLPPHIWHLPKRGFGSPTRQWLQTTLNHDVAVLARDPGQPLYTVLDYKAVQAVTRQMTRGHKQVWTLLMLNRWLAREAARR